eukprot:TRINITY_DN6338_c0_g1_i11.p1 TRINITY_DN6338_c0_g1~~TRINITY_DN6338_c0_g1_i11.p1  ORF type:complete len:941 (+),score=195.52 TRINITY_DN6338_c0_g1_i11:414-2825(+)
MIDSAANSSENVSNKDATWMFDIFNASADESHVNFDSLNESDVWSMYRRETLNLSDMVDQNASNVSDWSFWRGMIDDAPKISDTWTSDFHSSKKVDSKFPTAWDDYVWSNGNLPNVRNETFASSVTRPDVRSVRIPGQSGRHCFSVGGGHIAPFSSLVNPLGGFKMMSFNNLGVFYLVKATNIMIQGLYGRIPTATDSQSGSWLMAVAMAVMSEKESDPALAFGVRGRSLGKPTVAVADRDGRVTVDDRDMALGLGVSFTLGDLTVREIESTKKLRFATHEEVQRGTVFEFGKSMKVMTYAVELFMDIVITVGSTGKRRYSHRSESWEGLCGDFTEAPNIDKSKARQHEVAEIMMSSQVPVSLLQKESTPPSESIMPKELVAVYLNNGSYNQEHVPDHRDLSSSDCSEYRRICRQSINDRASFATSLKSACERDGCLGSDTVIAQHYGVFNLALRKFIQLPEATPEDWSLISDNAACRIATGIKSSVPGDNKTTRAWANVETIDGCRLLCAADKSCTGIEYQGKEKYCELWTTPVTAWKRARGFRCERYARSLGLSAEMNKTLLDTCCSVRAKFSALMGKVSSLTALPQTLLDFWRGANCEEMAGKDGPLDKCEESRKIMEWTPVNGRLHGVACWAGDEPHYHSVDASSSHDCKLVCRRNLDCKAVQYVQNGICEIWTRPVLSTTARSSSSCYVNDVRADLPDSTDSSALGKLAEAKIADTSELEMHRQQEATMTEEPSNYTDLSMCATQEAIDCTYCAQCLICMNMTEDPSKKFSRCGGHCDGCQTCEQVLNCFWPGPLPSS